MKKISECRESAGNLRRASFTIEAALLIPCILLVIFAVFYLNFHVCSRACLSAAACEQAISGHDPENPELFAAVNLSRMKEENGKTRTVSFAADTIALYGGWKWSISEKGEYAVVDPVSFIRKLRAAESLTED
jgi:hypothetical protein